MAVVSDSDFRIERLLNLPSRRPVRAGIPAAPEWAEHFVWLTDPPGGAI
jgi:hypothetical protein